MAAAAAATAGVLGAAGFAAGAAPWTQAVGNVALAAPGASHSVATAGQPGSSLFETVTGGVPRTGGSQLDVNHATVATGKAGAAARPPAAVHAGALAAKPPGKRQAAKPVQRQAAKPARHQAAKPARHQAAKPKAKPAPAKQYLIYDSVSPGTIPAGKAAAVYANGAYAASSRQVAGHNSVLWIDTNGSDPAANVLDVEPGDATPAGAAQWVKQRLSSQHNATAIVYTMMNDWQQVKDDVGNLPGWMQSHVRYWIADPTGVPHVVPGASATQWYWGNSYDITTANPNF